MDDNGRVFEFSDTRFELQTKKRLDVALSYVESRLACSASLHRPRGYGSVVSHKANDREIKKYG